MLKTLNFKNLINFILGMFFFILSINYFFDYDFLSQNIYNLNLLESSYFFGFIFFLGHILLNFYRWNLLLKNHQNIRYNFQANFTPFFSMILINFIFPFKVGDIYRVFSTRFIEKKKLISLIIFERILDILFVLFILYLGVILFLFRANLEYLKYFLFISLFFILIFFYCIYLTKKINILNKLKNIIFNFFLTLKINFLYVVSITLISWISELIFFYIIFKKIFNIFYIEELMISHSSSILAIILPSGPGLIGPVDFTLNGILSFYGHTTFEISTFIYLFHIFIFIICFKIFMIFIFLYPYKIFKKRILS